MRTMSCVLAAVLLSCATPARLPEAGSPRSEPPRARAAREQPAGDRGRTLSILSRRKQTESLWPITVKLAVSWRGYHVSATGEHLTPAELAQLERYIPLDRGRHDTRKLGEHLYVLKQRHPQSKQLVLSAEPAIRYATIVETLDAARERVEMVDGKPRRIELFPQVQFTTR